MDGFTLWLNESEMHSLLQACLDNYLDAPTLLVYADWFEERGDPMSDYIRGTVGMMNSDTASPERTDAIALLRRGMDGMRPEFRRQRIDDEAVTNDHQFVGPNPDGGRNQLHYRLIGNQVEVRRIRPTRWEPIPVEELPDAAARMVLIMRLREYQHGQGGEDQARLVRVATIQIRRCLGYLGSFFSRSINNSPCPAIRDNIDQIHSLVRRLEYYIQHPTAVTAADRATASWLLGLPTRIALCNLDTEDLANRLTQLLNTIRHHA